METQNAIPGKQLPDSSCGVAQIPRAAYLHIPFCRRRCFYCDFPVSVVGDRRNGSNSGTIVKYVDQLCREIAITPIFNIPLQTIFFGGGTPSLLSVVQIDRLIEALADRFGIAAEAEISMEIDPGTFDLAQIQGYRTAGINRVSLGVQSFADDLLKACGRSHCVADIYAAVDLLHQAQIPNFSLDLISGLPHLTIDRWQKDLETAIDLQPHHLSIYDLTLETGTVFDRYYQAGANPLPTDETSAQMYRLAQQTLTAAGYEHYEISNYARPGYQCHHNRTYWENRPYYGFGMGATSYTHGYRCTHPRKTGEYYQWLEEFIAAGGKLPGSPPPPNEVLLETLMLGLRLADGLDLEILARDWGSETLDRIWRCLQPYAQQGWVEIIHSDETRTTAKTLPHSGRLRLSDPEGFLFSNTLLASLFRDLG
ncbi:MAG: radical SAM family heme chaperone HemW [Geitlerinemataceae cyanobacterium]